MQYEKKEKTGQQTLLSLLWTAGSTPSCNVRVWGEEPGSGKLSVMSVAGYPACDSYIGVHKKSLRPMGTLADGNLQPQADRSTPGVKRSDKRRGYDQTWALYLAAEPALPFRNRNAYR